LRLLIESAEAQLSRESEHQDLAESTAYWLISLRERIAEVEEAFRARGQLVKLLMEGVTLGERRVGDPGKSTQVQITYRFGPPEAPSLGEGDRFVGGVTNSRV
jgi:hypothetical protein